MTEGQKCMSRKLPATAWPKEAVGDSDSLVRRKFAVRVGHAAMAAMVFVAVAGALAVSHQDYSLFQVVSLLAVSIVYIVWNLVGSRGLVTLVLWDKDAPPPVQTRVPPCGTMLYFLIQVALSACVYLTADRGQWPNLVWLLLLPPVAYAVFLLKWPGIAVVSTVMMAILIGSSCRWHSGRFAVWAALAFSFAILFTIVFTMLTVQSERARHEVQRLAGELGQANRQLREYVVQAEELSASRERNRIAREIHDSLGHFLTVANMQLQAARTLWVAEPDRAREAVTKAQLLTQEGLQDIRRSVAALRASPLENQSLADALDQLAVANASAETRVEFQLLGEPRRLSSPAELSLYRAGQEGLTNVRKHSKAGHTRVILDFQTRSKVALTVADDGVGAEQSGVSVGFGLLGLRERAQLLEGELRIETTPGEGFTLTFEVPG